MKRCILPLIILLSCVVVMDSAVAQKKVKVKDLAGKWVGPAYTPDGEDIITCTIEVKKGKITGTIFDELGFLNDSAIDSASVEDGNIYLETTVSTPDGDFTLVMKGAVKKDTIKGSWEIPATGDYGDWEAEKKKEEK